MILLPFLMMMQAGLLQPGGNPRPPAESELPIPREKKAEAAQPAADAPATRAGQCAALRGSDPAAAARFAGKWLADADAADDRRAARLCLGLSQAALLRWEEAEQTFTALSRETPLETEEAVAIRAMAGMAAIAGGFPDRAMVMLDEAIGGAHLIDPAQLGGIQIDRGRALVRLGRLDEARLALDQGTRLLPEDPEGWLLSATLYRRVRDLVPAQQAIEKAAQLASDDPAIGLEAGVIAMLDGREAAARLSWNSVIALAPKSNEARIAQGYLEQIGPETGDAEGTRP